MPIENADNQKFSNSPPPSTTPDPLADFTEDGGGAGTALQNQATQQDLIAQLEFEDHTGIKIDGILGGLPVAEKNQEYFLIIDEAGDTTPEILGQTQFKISYLVDSQLNVSKPSGDGIALSNVLQNFERQKNAIVRVDQGTVLNNQLAGTHKITAVGSLEPVAGTQIGTGPLDYVTTMSFQLKDQLGAAPGIQVATYYAWINKSLGFQNMNLSYKRSGQVPFGYNNAWTNPNVSESNSTNPFRLYYDSLQVATGSAVNPVAVSVSNPPSFPPGGIDSSTSNYFNQINIATGSIQGNTRIKLKGAFGINISTSSIQDLYVSALADRNYNFNKPIRMNLYKESGGVRTLLSTKTKTINTFNGSIKANTQGPGLNINAAESLKDKDTDAINNFDFKPNSVAYLSLESDFFSVEEGDKLYSELVLPNEESSSRGPFINTEFSSYFTESLNAWRNQAAYRQYQYFNGYLIINQETPEGANFVHGVTGVTASYFTTSSGATFASQSLYNNSGSYWIGFNNFSSSEDATFGQPQSYVTASTALTFFYGGDYVQVNPGIESYNTVNASTSISSSLGTGIQKKTWERFGFNPIRLAFIPRPGDFIRFEYSKSKTYQILKVVSAGNTLKLLLDNHIDSGTVLDNFVIYRVVEDGQFIILDVEKNNEASVDQLFTGLISPEFSSTGLRERSNTLLFDLKQAGIIKD